MRAFGTLIPGFVAVALACAGPVALAYAAEPRAATAPAPPPQQVTPSPSGPQAASPPRTWVLHCADPQPDHPRDCRLSATAFSQSQQQRVLVVTLLRQPETRSLALTFQVAHGVALSAGLSWQIDDGAAQHLAFQTSDPEGVYAGVPISDDLFDALRRGTMLRTSFSLAGRRETLTVSVPLAQFAEGSAEFSTAERQRLP